MPTKNIVTKAKPSKSIAKAGEVITKNVCFRKHLLETLEENLDKIKEETGYNPTRSKAITILSEILIKADKYLNKKNIHDDESFKTEIIVAIKNL